MATKLAGYLYDKEATAEGEGAERVCVGARCYRCVAAPRGLYKTPNPSTTEGEGAERVCVGARCHRCAAGPRGVSKP